MWGTNFRFINVSSSQRLTKINWWSLVVWRSLLPCSRFFSSFIFWCGLSFNALEATAKTPISLTDLLHTSWIWDSHTTFVTWMQSAVCKEGRSYWDCTHLEGQGWANKGNFFPVLLAHKHQSQLADFVLLQVVLYNQSFLLVSDSQTTECRSLVLPR